MNFTEQKLTGKASIDKPWLNFYPEQFRNLEIPRITIEAFLKMKNPNEDKIAFEYYGNKITWKQLWEGLPLLHLLHLYHNTQYLTYHHM